MKLFCRHCWKFSNSILFKNDPHISAVCEDCDNFIKHLNKTEKTAVLRHKLTVEKNKTGRSYKNRQPYGKKNRLQENRSNA